MITIQLVRTHKSKRYLPRTAEEKEHIKIQEFLDMCAPTAIKFYPDHYICGSTYCCVWAVREYPTETNEQAILRHLGEKSGVTLRIYSRHVTPAEERKIINNAASKGQMERSSSNLQQTVIAEANLQNVTNLIAQMHRNREPLLHCAVFIEISSITLEKLKELGELGLSLKMRQSRLTEGRKKRNRKSNQTTSEVNNIWTIKHTTQ